MLWVLKRITILLSTHNMFLLSSGKLHIETLTDLGIAMILIIYLAITAILRSTYNVNDRTTTKSALEEHNIGLGTRHFLKYCILSSYCFFLSISCT